MTTDLDDLLTALYVFADDFLTERDPSRLARKPRISDARMLAFGAWIWHNWQLWEAGEIEGPFGA